VLDNSFLLYGKDLIIDNNFYLSAENTGDVDGIDQFFSNYQAITSGDTMYLQ
jgi:hypothetical protein